jgi:hypothetical protein
MMATTSLKSGSRPASRYAEGARMKIEIEMDAEAAVALAALILRADQ